MCPYTVSSHTHDRIAAPIDGCTIPKFLQLVAYSIGCHISQRGISVTPYDIQCPQVHNAELWGQTLCFYITATYWYCIAPMYIIVVYNMSQGENPEAQLSLTFSEYITEPCSAPEEDEWSSLSPCCLRCAVSLCPPGSHVTHTADPSPYLQGLTDASNVLETRRLQCKWGQGCSADVI